ncbi:hypothetical protein SLEP1_g32453 [Rubroshorea leprosula]|uniref:Protein kinase domain-containing protein n=1 Tax=Rubroshorea leprosula TaxID=152421 RepID=A0AAV5KDI9_9ROSI|nr:hypothetical protein SLEP1_g32453 [Rubroshorea leprosula]
MDNSSFSFLIFLLFFSFHPFYSASSFPTFSISETSNQTLICALVQPSRCRQPSVNCSSFPSGSGIQTLEIPYVSGISGIIGGDGFFCTLRFGSIIRCWRFSNMSSAVSPKAKRIRSGPPLTQLEAGNSHFCGLVNGTNNLRCWQWPEFNRSWVQSFSNITVGGEFVCGLLETGEIRCKGNINGSIGEWPKGNNYRVISAGLRHACVINSSGDLNCWGDIDRMDKAPQGKFLALALGENRSCALRTDETVVCWGQNNFTLPESLQETYFLAIEAKRSVFCGVVKSNYSLFCWGNEIFNTSFMVFSEILPGSCRNQSQCPCGPLTGSSEFCGSGQSICQSCPEHIPPWPVVPPSPQPSASPALRQSSSGWNGRMLAFLVVGCVGSSSMLLVIGFFLFRYCKGRGCRVHDSGRLDEAGDLPEEGGAGQPQPPLPLPPPPVLEKRLSQLTSIGTSHLEEFSIQVLLQATNNFSDEHKIGSGSFGSVYHATLDDGREVAVKRAELSATSSYAFGNKRQGQEDKDLAFLNELESLCRLHHKNLVRLLGFCEDCNERVLVYEYMSNGTLHDHLHKLDDSPLMSWVARIKVALDAARGIQYLHEFAVPPIIHRDIKSSNILLDEIWTAKVSDFGLSLMGPKEDESPLSLRAAGTVGYMDPEYYRLQLLTSKSDVYSFGVVLLELLSGYKAIHRNENDVPRNVVDYVVPYIFKDEIHRVLDQRVPPPTPFEIEAVAHVGYIAADCVTREGRDRPSMSVIVNSLERALLACVVHPSLSRSTTGRESIHSL